MAAVARRSLASTLQRCFQLQQQRWAASFAADGRPETFLFMGPPGERPRPCCAGARVGGGAVCPSVGCSPPALRGVLLEAAGQCMGNPGSEWLGSGGGGGRRRRQRQ